MNTTLKLISLAIIFVTFLPNIGLAFDIEGRWIQKNINSNDDIKTYNFHREGYFELYKSSVIESTYEIENNIIMVTSLSPQVDPPVDNYVYEINDNQMTIQRVVKDKPLELSEPAKLVRLYESNPSDINEIVGQWKFIGFDQPFMTNEYTNDGVKYSKRNKLYINGRYKTDHEFIYMVSGVNNSVTLKYTLENDSLILNKEKYIKVK